MRISIRELVDKRPGVLAGAITGRKVFVKLVERTGREPSEPETLFLDFADVEVATASFLRESVLAFHKDVRQRRSKFYPIIANANEVVREEIAVLLAARGDVLMVCSLGKKGEPYEDHLIGDLDPKQRLTFDLVHKRGETTAAELYKANNTDQVEQTAWNNRLTALASLGLIVELSQGRSKRYRPLLKGVEHGP